MEISRRKFLTLSASAGAMLMTISLPSQGRNHKPNNTDPAWSVYLRINEDNSITIESPVQDTGQHMKTTGPMMIAEELDADWALVSCVAAKTHLTKTEQGLSYKFAHMDTGGSHAVRNNWNILREAGATARKLLMQVASQKWKCPIEEVNTHKSYVIRAKTGQKFSYGELAPIASSLPLPKERIPFKDKSSYHILGNNVTTVDIDEMITGKPLFGLDAEVPNMVHAVIERCPYFHGDIKAYDNKATLSIPGVITTIKIEKVFDDHGDKEVVAGIAVIAKDYWTAKKGRDALKIEWDQGPWKSESSDGLMKDFESFCMGDDDGRNLINDGDINQGFKESKQILDHSYQVPLLAHACMEPFNAIADISDKYVKIITGHQFPIKVASAVAKHANVDPLEVEVVNVRSGGGFGRRYYNDFVIEATILSKHIGKPVKLTWTREDEISQDYFGFSTFARIRAGTNEQGKLISWHHRQGQIGGSIREQCFPYQLIDNFKVDSYHQKAGTPIGAWRGPGHLQFAFATESMIDEVAHANDQDPLSYRLELLGAPKEYSYKGYGGSIIDSGRMAKCYKAAADLARWKDKRPTGIGLGIAAHFTFGSYAAFVVEVDSTKGKQIKITGIWGVIDCGFPLNPNHIKNQMEGGFIDGLNAALYNEIKVENGRVVNTNFDQLPWIKMNDIPPVFEVSIVDNDYPPTGVGEPPTAPAAAALANAIFAATGKRLRKLPISMET